MAENPFHGRRELLRLCGHGLLSVSFNSIARSGANPQKPFILPGGEPYQGTDELLLDEFQRATFDFFWNEASTKTGQVKDRALANGHDTRIMSSIAATGFGLTRLCIGERRGFGKRADILERVRNTLRFLANATTCAGSGCW